MNERHTNLRKCIKRCITTLQRQRPKKQGNRVRDVKPQVFCDTLSDRLAEVMVAKVAGTLPNLKTASTALTLFPTLAVMKPAHLSAHLA